MNTLKKYLVNTEVDFINGDLFKCLIIFMIPILISNIFQQLYNTVDTMIVGNYLGDNSLAAIGACNSIYDLLVGFALGLGNGFAIVTARCYGSNDRKLLKKSVASAIVIGILASIILTVIGVIAIRPLLTLLDTPAEIFEEAYSYIIMIVLFVAVMFAYNLCAALMRAIGNSVMPLVFLIISSLLNIGLDLLLITQFNLGVQGAGIATVLAQGFSVILCVIYMMKKTKILLPSKSDFKVDMALYKEMAGQGFSMGIMSSIVNAGSVILQYGINNLGTLVIAGHTAARKLYMFFNMPFVSIANAVATCVSQNKGAGNGKRIRKAIKYSYIYSIVVAAIVTLIIFLFGGSLVKLISGSSEPVVLNNATLYLKVVGPFYAILGILMSTRFALQGLGKKLLPLVSSIIEFCGKIIFVLVFIPMFEYMAVIFCEPTIWCIMCIQLVWSFYHHPFIVEAKGAD